MLSIEEKSKYKSKVNLIYTWADSAHGRSLTYIFLVVGIGLTLAHVMLKSK